MSSVHKQPNGRWRARYRDAYGRSGSKTFDRKADAQFFLDERSTDLRRGDWIDPRTQKITFDEWAARWWASTTKLRPTTRRGYWGAYSRHVLPYFSGRRIAEIDYMDVETFVADRIALGLSPKYVRQCVSILSLIMKTAVRSNVRRDNPAADHHIPMPRRKIREGDVLNMEQVHQLVLHVPDSYRPAVWLLLLTGLRPAELCGLRVCDLESRKSVIHVRQTLLPLHGFDTEVFQLVTGPPKTAAGDRSIPIPEWLSAELDHMVTEGDGRTNRATGPDAPLFQTRYGNPLNRDKLRSKVIRPALRAAGLPESIRTYDLRHSHASLLIDLGANLLAVAQRMGHSDPAITLRVYGHLFEGTQAELSRQLEELRVATAPRNGTVAPMRRSGGSCPRDLPRARESALPNRSSR